MSFQTRCARQAKPTALHALNGSVSPRRRQIFIGDPFCDTERPPPADSPRFYISYILSIDPHVTRTRPFQAGDDAQQSRFSATREAYCRNGLAIIDLQ